MKHPLFLLLVAGLVVASCAKTTPQQTTQGQLVPDSSLDGSAKDVLESSNNLSSFQTDLDDQAVNEAAAELQGLDW